MLVQDLITRIRAAVNDTQAIEFPDSELIGYINDILSLLSVELARLRAHLLLTSADIPVPAGSNSVPLPSDFMKEETLFWVDGNGQVSTLEETGYNAENDTGTPKSYYKDGGNIYLYPTPDADGTLRLAYYRRIPPVAGLSDSIDLPSFFEEVILRAVAMRAKTRIELDPSIELRLKSFLDRQVKDFLKLYGSWGNARKVRAV